MTEPLQVLFLCTGNSARSILAESLLRHLAPDRFVSHSAGSYPKGAVHPLALETLTAHGLPTIGLRSKSWDEFERDGAPKLDFIFTVCDNAAGEVCPIWPGRPISAHWGIPDPAAVAGDLAQRRQSFEGALVTLKSYIEQFLRLDPARTARTDLHRALAAIGAAGQAQQ